MMNSILGHMSPIQLVLYMDDLCIFSDSFQSHLERLEQVFQTLLNHGLCVNGKKCQLSMTEVIFCGYRVNADGLSPDSEKTAAIAKIPSLSSIKEVKSFLGMTGWYRRFIPRYATIASFTFGKHSSGLPNVKLHLSF